MVTGSVIVNGVRFDDSSAEVIIDDTPKSATDLQDGMVVKVEGRVGADSIAKGGNALRVEAQIEVRGLVSAVFPGESPQRFVVLGQNVLVDDLTVYSDLTGFDDIAVDDLLEVHGLRDTGMNVRASRVEANTAQMANPLVDQIRGVVSNRTNDTDPLFNVGTQLVNATGANTLPIGAMYADGDVVEATCTLRPNCINGSSEFVASLIEVERAEDAGFEPGMDERLEAEGFVSGFDSPGDANFNVGGVPVTTTGTTRYQGGAQSDLGNDIKVEAEGIWKGSALIANKIEFTRAVVRLQGEPSAPSGDTFELAIADLGVVTIETDDFTVLTDGTLPVGDEACIQVRGERKAVQGQVVTATVITLSCGDGDRPFIQAPAEEENPEVTMTLLGFVIDVSNPTGLPPFADIDEEPLTRTEFFDAVSPLALNNASVPETGTLVKVTFDEFTDAVSQAEIQD